MSWWLLNQPILFWQVYHLFIIIGSSIIILLSISTILNIRLKRDILKCWFLPLHFILHWIIVVVTSIWWNILPEFWHNLISWLTIRESWEFVWLFLVLFGWWCIWNNDRNVLEHAESLLFGYFLHIFGLDDDLFVLAKNARVEANIVFCQV